jgi:hypothetical protein
MELIEGPELALGSELGFELIFGDGPALSEGFVEGPALVNDGTLDGMLDG